MPCPDSPENGFDRYQLPATGRTLNAACVYCGAAKTFRPFESTPAWQQHNGQPQAAAASKAARRATQAEDLRRRREES